jgi:uncharacterized protein (DUF2141 family)
MKTSSMPKLFASSLFLASCLFSINTYAHDLVLKIDKITNTKGVIMIALHNSASTYESDQHMFSAKKMAITENTLTVHFGDIPKGDYAIKLFQDENENGRIDKNDLGVPTEGYGFSNNSDTMGQPSFEEAKFSVNSATTLTIHLR